MIRQFVKVIASERFEYVPPEIPPHASTESTFQLTTDFRIYQLPNVYTDPNAQSPMPEYGFAGSFLDFIGLGNQLFDVIVNVIAVVPSDYVECVARIRGLLIAILICWTMGTKLFMM